MCNKRKMNACESPGGKLHRRTRRYGQSCRIVKHKSMRRGTYTLKQYQCFIILFNNFKI
jgi:hypothetical protein